MFMAKWLRFTESDIELLSVVEEEKLRKYWGTFKVDSVRKTLHER